MPLELQTQPTIFLMETAQVITQVEEILLGPCQFEQVGASESISSETWAEQACLEEMLEKVWREYCEKAALEIGARLIPREYTVRGTRLGLELGHTALGLGVGNGEGVYISK